MGRKYFRVGGGTQSAGKYVCMRKFFRAPGVLADIFEVTGKSYPSKARRILMIATSEPRYDRGVCK